MSFGFQSTPFVLFQMSPLVFFMLIQLIHSGTLELILPEESLGDIQLSDLQAMAELVEKFTLPSQCKRQVDIYQITFLPIQSINAVLSRETFYLILSVYTRVVNAPFYRYMGSDLCVRVSVCH